MEGDGGYEDVVKMNCVGERRGVRTRSMWNTILVETILPGEDQTTSLACYICYVFHVAGTLQHSAESNRRAIKNSIQECKLIN